MCHWAYGSNRKSEHCSSLRHKSQLFAPTGVSGFAGGSPTFKCPASGFGARGFQNRRCAFAICGYRDVTGFRRQQISIRVKPA